VPLTKERLNPVIRLGRDVGSPSPSLPKPTLSSSLPPLQALHAILTNLQTVQVPQHHPIMPLSLTTQTSPKERAHGTRQKSLSCVLYLSERCVNKHGDLCHGHCQGLDDGHSLCPSKCHVCMKISAPPAATKRKGTCGCCVNCSQRNPTFL